MCQVNPLAETPEGRVVVCDAKLNFDDNAEFRQKEVFEFRDRSQVGTPPRARLDACDPVPSVHAPHSLPLHLAPWPLPGAMESLPLCFALVRLASPRFASLRLALNCLALPSLALLCPALPSLALPCHALPSLALPCHASLFFVRLASLD